MKVVFALEIEFDVPKDLVSQMPLFSVNAFKVGMSQLKAGDERIKLIGIQPLLPLQETGAS